MAGNSTSTAPAKVDATTSATDLIAANTRNGRKGASVYYDGAAILYLLAGSGTPSSTLFTAKLGDGYLTYWEAPAGYQGAVRGIWSAATGAALVTEYV